MAPANRPPLATQWTDGPRTAAWDELWRRIVTDVLRDTLPHESQARIRQARRDGQERSNDD